MVTVTWLDDKLKTTDNRMGEFYEYMKYISDLKKLIVDILKKWKNKTEGLSASSQIVFIS